MKTLLMLLTLLLSFLVFNSCSNEKCPERVRCKTDSDCFKDYGKNSICYDSTKHPEDKKNIEKLHEECYTPTSWCISDICKEDKIDCGDGNCKMRVNNVLYIEYPTCECDENALLRTNASFSPGKCFSDYTCDTNNNCIDMYKTINNDIKETPLCLDNKCVENN